MSKFCAQDSAFGPQSQCRSFDFTLMFENAILSMVPSAIALALFVSYIRLAVSRKIIGVSVRRPDVLIAFILNLALNILTLIAWTTAKTTDVPVLAGSYLTAALVLSLVVSILNVILVSNELSRKDSSFATSLYLLIVLLLDASRLRTFSSAGKSTISMFFFVAFAASFAIRGLCLVLMNAPEPKESGVRKSSGFFSSIFLLWLLPLMWKGRKGTLNLDDLPDFDQKSTALYMRFETSWRREKRKTHPKLLKALLRAFLPTFMSPVIPAILMSLTQVVQPAMVNAAIQFIDSYSSNSPEPVEWGWSLAGMFAFIFLTLTCASTLYWYCIARTSAYIRGTMSEAVYRKTLALNVTCLASVPGGNPMNLISADIDRITSVIDPLHQMWSSLITIAIGLYLIYNELGAAFVATIVMTIVIMVVTPYFSREIRPLQTKLSAAGDKRIRLISGILRQIKGIKLSAYEPELIKKVSEVRTAELQARKNFWRKFYLIVCTTSVTMNALSLATLGTYAIISFLSRSQGLTTARLFTAYTAIGIITAPIYAIGQNYPRVLAAYACIKRLEGYLLSLESKSSQSVDSSSVSAFDSETEGSTKGDVISGMEEITYDEKMNISEPRISGTASFCSACIGWSDKVLLYDLNAEIPVGMITMVIGRVASGKSTFLHSLLEETQILSGTISYPWKRGSIAYCSQTPWLQPSQSIRNNILFASSYEQAWYTKVIRACALEFDLEKMKNGDSTLASGLSGGQKARVALARAVYSRKPVVVLDDVFSALDGPTANSVFEALFSRGLGLLTHKTVILSTNKMAHLNFADWIISLNECRISTQGTYSDLRGVESVLKEVESTVEATSLPNGPVSGPKKPSFKMEELPDNTKSIAMRSYMHYCRAASWYCIAMYLLLLLLTVGIQTITPVYLQVWSTYNDSHFSNRKSVVAYLPGYAAIEIAYTFALCYVFYYMIMILSQNASRNLHEWQFSAVMHAPMSFFDSTQVGQTINRFSQDIAYIDGGLPLALYDFFYQMVRAIGGIIVMIIALPYMAAVVFGVVVVFYLVQWFYLATSKRVRRLDLASKSPLYTLYQETMMFDALLTVRAAGAEGHYLDSSEILLARSQRPFYLSRNVAAWLVSSIGIMTSIVNTSVVLLAITTRRSASAGLFAAAMSQAISLQDMLNTMLTSWTKLEMAAVSLERNLDLVNIVPEDDDDKFQGPGISDDKEWPSRGEIELTNVMAKYRVTPILKDVSFRAPAGSSLGICGRTGSGKSTVLLALLRALHVEGEILIDGKNIMNISRRRLRKGMTMVGQEPFLLDGTIRENLDITGCKSDDDVWAAIESAQLKPAITKLSGGIDHQIQSISPILSPGQIQLLALARSLLSGKKIILLDEATAALDGETDDSIQEVIRSSFKDCTCITIAHRIKTIKDYDQVVVLNHGLVEEMGNPAELLQKEGSVFRELAQASEE
ncbi:P-loop containing nucleoside triphosphate hydrolase protein [Lentinula aff. lateritia]|uniref:P-loop containing nucleoside triphosphate hydrolase protein n=1 Tax=Lentinula aff. lateritia TaxID=2804960 RepID=A0ACC1TYR0_9AGAR|nr:P-loop containing nucleoside triphosphate hydrolase protein [Lentinula aff. lateritia]